jgi:hypothetical protein
MQNKVKVLKLEEFVSESESTNDKYYLSEKAKMVLEKACNEYLIKEAIEFHNDNHKDHTYESYVNKCRNYLSEIMGNEGYSSLDKLYKR